MPVLVRILKIPFIRNFLTYLRNLVIVKHPYNWLYVNAVPFATSAYIGKCEGPQQINSVYVRTRWRHRRGGRQRGFANDVV